MMVEGGKGSGKGGDWWWKGGKGSGREGGGRKCYGGVGVGDEW